MDKSIKTTLLLTAMLAAGCADSVVAPRGESSDVLVPNGVKAPSHAAADTLRQSFVRSGYSLTSGRDGGTESDATLNRAVTAPTIAR